jgi:O-acetyl-ADP-ribose deacetylase (regulator of RNase III)
MRRRALQADITTLDVDAIVNAANRSLSPGAGVCGAIHAAAGDELAKACRRLGGCDTGDAKITPGYRLPARWVIHTVGPIYRAGEEREAEALLASCYRRSLELAGANDIDSLAFPCISTGVYGYPPRAAATCAVSTVAGHARAHPGARPREVIFCCFSPADLEIYRALLD